jgi:Flp pilus assembly pilin Flp
MKLLRRMRDCRAGGSAVEYALIIAIIGAAVVIGMMSLNTGFRGSMDNSKAAIEKDY